MLEDDDEMPAFTQDPAWIEWAKAKIARSLADPRPALSGAELHERLERFLDELYDKENDAAT